MKNLLVGWLLLSLTANQAALWANTLGDSQEVIVLHPYRVEVAGIKQELAAYRQMYLVVAILIMSGLIYVANK
jgi:hypothetical protein